MSKRARLTEPVLFFGYRRRMKVLAMVALVGCGDNRGTSPPIDSPPDEPPCGPSFAERSFRIVQSGNNPGGPLPDAQLCLAGTASCVTASAEGIATTCVPALTDYVVSVGKTDFETAVYRIDAAAAGPFTLQIGDVGFVSDLWADSTGTFPPEADGLMFIVVAGVSGVTIAIDPPSGGVTYGDADQIADSSLTMTSSSNTAYVGDLTEGIYDITITPAPASCRNIVGVDDPPQLGGWEPTTAGTQASAPVFSGATTVVALDCTP